MVTVVLPISHPLVKLQRYRGEMKCTVDRQVTNWLARYVRHGNWVRDIEIEHHEIVGLTYEFPPSSSCGSIQAYLGMSHSVILPASHTLVYRVWWCGRPKLTVEREVTRWLFSHVHVGNWVRCTVYENDFQVGVKYTFKEVHHATLFKLTWG